MPWVTIRTGTVAADGQEVVLREYQCDWPDCGAIAETVVGVVRELRTARAVCREHATLLQTRAFPDPAR
jgi:hypothetical protein